MLKILAMTSLIIVLVILVVLTAIYMTIYTIDTHAKDSVYETCVFLSIWFRGQHKLTQQYQEAYHRHHQPITFDQTRAKLRAKHLDHQLEILNQILNVISNPNNQIVHANGKVPAHPIKTQRKHIIDLWAQYYH